MSAEQKWCVYCGQTGHRSHACPRRVNLPQVGAEVRKMDEELTWVDDPENDAAKAYRGPHCELVGRVFGEKGWPIAAADDYAVLVAADDYAVLVRRDGHWVEVAREATMAKAKARLERELGVLPDAELPVDRRLARQLARAEKRLAELERKVALIDQRTQVPANGVRWGPQVPAAPSYRPTPIEAQAAGQCSSGVSSLIPSWRSI